MTSSSSRIQNRDMLALRAYVQGGDHDAQRHALLTEQNVLLLDLTHSNLQQQHIEVRFARHDTVATLKHKIYQKTGTPEHHQHLQIYDGPRLWVDLGAASSKQDHYKLGYFNLEHGMRVHCIDTNPYSGSAHGAYEDTSLVEKYVMSDEVYRQRQGTLHAWARAQKQQNPNFTLKQHALDHQAAVQRKRMEKLQTGDNHQENNHADPRSLIQQGSHNDNNTATNKNDPAVEFGVESVADIAVAARCEIQPGSRRGTVGFVGSIPELRQPGYWVGVVLDEPVGKNDGSVTLGDGKRRVVLTNCPGPGYGAFVRPTHVTVGDFPERDLLLEDESDDEDEL